MTDSLHARHRYNGSLIICGGAAMLLCVPLIAMQFTTEVAWTGFDFAVFGAMLACACGVYEIAVRLTRNSAYRTGIAVAVAAAFLLVWINLAVGMIGSENNPANLMYACVLAVAVIGAIIAGFRARGMARAFVVVALAQAAVGVVAWLSVKSPVVMLDGVFALLWLLAAWLFHTAANATRGAK